MNMVPLRLGPGDDLRLALEGWLSERDGQAAWVINDIGSLTVARIRLAGQDGITSFCGDLELLHLAGSLCLDGADLHRAVADNKGVVTGGHLCAGTLVRTTAEVLLGALPQGQFPSGAGSS